ncbi:MAG TPA: hypothetical protein VGM88_06810 [Kofleriaceae bacterium]
MLTRRGFVAAAAAASSLLVIGCGDNLGVRGRFLSADAYAALRVAAEQIFPGAADAGAIDYIDQLCVAFDQDPPAIFGGGPFSGRTPVPDAHGAPTKTRPADAFATFLPLSRVQEIAWRMRVFGSAATTGGDFNDALLGPTVGYRDLYAELGAAFDVAAAAQVAGAKLVDLEGAALMTAVFTVAAEQPEAWATFTNHVLEGMFAAPEYGGNQRLAGWQLASFDGDSAPLGHSCYDATIDAYVDRADEPTSTASPGSMPEDFDADIISLLALSAVGSGGMRFF